MRIYNGLERPRMITSDKSVLTLCATYGEDGTSLASFDLPRVGAKYLRLFGDHNSDTWASGIKRTFREPRI